MANGVVIPSKTVTDWIDVTKSGQSYGSAKYKIHNGTLFIYIFKSTTQVASWQTIGNLPSDVYSMIDVDTSSIPYMYTTIFNNVSTYAVGYVDFPTGIIQALGNTSADTIIALPYKG